MSIVEKKYETYQTRDAETSRALQVGVFVRSKCIYLSIIVSTYAGMSERSVELEVDICEKRADFDEYFDECLGDEKRGAFAKHKRSYYTNRNE